MNPIYKEFQYGDQTVVMETNKVAKQATGSVTVTIGDTVVLTTVVGKERSPGAGLLPPDGELSRKDLCGRKNPRRILSPRRSSE